MSGEDEKSRALEDENVLPIRDLFYFSHFSSFYKHYVPAAIVIGVVCGLFMALFAWLIDAIFLLSQFLPLFIAPLIGGLFSGLLIFAGRKEVKGSGISTAIEMTHNPGAMKDSTAVTKMLATAVSIGTHNPVGREGPAVLIGATIGNAVARTFRFNDPAYRRIFIMMGSAAATAGIYKAPLGGALFATEAPYRRDARLGYFVPTVIAALTSYLVFSFIRGIHPLFGFEASLVLSLELVPLFLLLGVLAGGISLLFAAVLMTARNYFTLKLPSWADPVIGSLLACILIFFTGLFLDPSLTIAGWGYEVIDVVAQTSLPAIVLITLLIGKLLASSFVVGARVSGGVLAPSLFVGAMLGKLFGEIFSPGNETAFMVLGMGAVLAATTNTPVATTVLILEISRSFDLVIPLALCVVVAYLVSGGSSLYEGQKLCRDDEEQDYYAPINILPETSLEFDTDDSNPVSSSSNDETDTDDTDVESRIP